MEGFGKPKAKISNPFGTVFQVAIEFAFVTVSILISARSNFY
jgi:hypothetical protein